MVDYVKIRVKAGSGGKGHVSFRRSKGKPYGPPDGGDGGDGGNVFIKATTSLSTLIPYRYKKDFKADDGASGGKSLKKGAKGKDLVLEVPLGTILRDESGFTISDLIKDGQAELVALGGKGGRGNSHAKMSNLPAGKAGVKFQMPTSEGSRSPKWAHLKQAEPGQPGEEVNLTLELKLLADVGLVGLPNAGKSTLLSKLTSARPKISAHPFTTLEPNLGVMYHKDKEVVIADIPGLIEGASRGKGLGDQFLRHVERTRVLVHLVSAESQNPFADIVVIKNELREYSKHLPEGSSSLGDKPEVMVLTKIDTLMEEDLKNKIDQFKNYNIKALPMSASTGKGLDDLKDKIIELAAS